MQNHTVMIVEDERGVAEMLDAVLQTAGYGTIVVHGVKPAIDALRKSRPDLILLDVMMPGVPGLEFCRYLKREPEFMDLPVIIISAMDRPEDVRAGLEAGASRYFGKPIDIDDLRTAVDEELNLDDAGPGEG